MQALISKSSLSQQTLALGAFYGHQSTLTRRFAWKIGNDIHYVVCGCIASQHMGFMRPLQAILCVADHKYANTWYFAHEYYRYDVRRAALGQYWLADCCQNGLF